MERRFDSRGTQSASLDIVALLSQLVHNLADNAFKYSSPGTRVNVRAERQGHELVISVRDHGGGILKEDQPAIFEPFFRSTAARRSGVPGVGLGLPIVQRITQSLQGRIEFDSVPGEGSTFRLRLPLQPPSLGASERTASDREPADLSCSPWVEEELGSAGLVVNRNRQHAENSSH